METIASQFLPYVYGAIIVEGLVQIIANIKEGERSWKYWGSLAAGIALAILVAVAYDIDFFKMLGMETDIPFLGPVLTGLLISRGSNYASDIIGKIRIKPNGPNIFLPKPDDSEYADPEGLG